MSVLSQSFDEKATGCLGCCTENSHPFPRSRHAESLDDYQGRLAAADQQKKQEIDNMLLEAFKSLTFEERQAQQEQLHGVADQNAEEASFIESTLRKIEFHLSRTKAGRVYEIAERMNPGYVHARSFRVTFLRADRYNAKAAADRMLRFFDEKQKLFGTAKLTKDITTDDLDPDDIAAVKTGAAQWAGRDRSNRPILLQLPGLRNFKELKNDLRARYFITMEGLKSPEAQLRGVVVITYTIGDFKDCHQGLGYLEHHRLADALPLYLGASHFVVDDIKQYLIGSAAFSIMPADFRARFRLHLATHLESRYILSSFGISPALLPISPETNNIDMVPHLRWCESRMPNSKNNGTIHTRISSSFSESIITEPNPNDVLSAGFTKMENIGNERLRQLVKDSLEAYHSGSNEEKRRIVNLITDEVHEAGGRFLEKKKGAQTWSEIPLSRVREKITQRFRNHTRRRESARQQAQEGTLIVGQPLPNDVVFGRTQYKNYGTALLHHLIKERSGEYEALDRGMKAVVVDGIIERIQRDGGRFLQPSSFDLKRYVELSSADSIRDRISTYVRNYQYRKRVCS